MDDRTIHLLRRYSARTISHDELEELREFIAASPENREVFLHFARLCKIEIQAGMLQRADSNKG